MPNTMFKWINAFLNENKTTYVGLSQLREKNESVKPVQKPEKEKNLKISDLMRGLS